MVKPMAQPQVAHDGDSVGSLGLKGRPFGQVRVFVKLNKNVVLDWPMLGKK